ncbi:MAG: hypothetical protein M0Q88_03065 [Bacilli bacterium]|nr:hypothetical protein [Bacilli bacterium]
MNKVPCFACERRECGCHSGCDEYKEYKKELDYAKSKRREHFSVTYEYKREVMRKNRFI